jgi:S-adenosyl methyltransferase
MHAPAPNRRQRAAAAAGSDLGHAARRQRVNDADEQQRLAARGLDITVPNVARIYDCILGGTDNFEADRADRADRAAAEQILAVIPGGPGPARMNRAFLGRSFISAEPAWAGPAMRANAKKMSA